MLQIGLAPLSFFCFIHSKTRLDRHYYCAPKTIISYDISLVGLRHTGAISASSSFAAPLRSGGCRGVVSSGAVMVTGMGLGGTFISIWSSDNESILHRVSLDGERTDGNRPAVRRSKNKKKIQKLKNVKMKLKTFIGAYIKSVLKIYKNKNIQKHS